MTYTKKQVLVVVKTYPNLSKKYDKTVCTAGIDLETMAWIRIFPIMYFDLPQEQRFKKYDVIEIEVEFKKDRFARKESHKAHGNTIKIIKNIGTEHNWIERKNILLPKVQKSINNLQTQYKMDKTSMGIIKPKSGIAFKVTPIESCRPWEKDLIMGKQRTLDGLNYSSPLEKIPYKFSYVFKCNDPECTKEHDLMIEDWEICELYRKMKQTKDEKYALEQVAKKYKEYFLASCDIHLVLGTESKWNKWLIIGIFYPQKQAQTMLPFN